MGGVSTNQKETNTQPTSNNSETIANTENIAPTSEQQAETQKKIEKSIEVLTKELDYGKNEPVKVDSSLQKASVLTALKDPGNYPERLSVAHLPAPFDLESYKKDPNTYLNTIEPARVFQSAQPNDKVAILERISEKFPVIKQNEKTILKVKALPEMPVTFTSFDLGRFENELNSITVKANQEGFAQAEFLASKGTIAKVNILASCPVTSGQVKFVVDVR